MDADTLTIWKYLRGEMPPAEFAQWVRQTPELEHLLGAPLYQMALSTDYRTLYSTQGLRDALTRRLDELQPRSCPCLTWKDEQTVRVTTRDEANRITSRWTIVFSKSDWQYAAQCKECGQCWHVVEDEEEKALHLRRMSEQEAQQADEDLWPEQEVQPEEEAAPREQLFPYFNKAFFAVLMSCSMWCLLLFVFLLVMNFGGMFR